MQRASHDPETIIPLPCSQALGTGLGLGQVSCEQSLFTQFSSFDFSLTCESAKEMRRNLYEMWAQYQRNFAMKFGPRKTKFWPKASTCTVDPGDAEV